MAGFILEAEFDKYLQLMQLKKDEMSALQLQEARRAFYAGVGNLFMYFLEVFPMLNDVQKDMVTRQLNQDLQNYWLLEMAIHNKKSG